MNLIGNIGNIIGENLRLCLFPSTAPIPRDKNDPNNEKIAKFIPRTILDIEAFWNGTLGNEKIFYELISQSEWHLAREFYENNPGGIILSYSENSPFPNSLYKMLRALHGQKMGNCEKRDLDILLELVFEKDADIIDLFQEMPFPITRVLDYLVHTNQLKLVHGFIENLMKRGDIASAKKIFIAIKDLLQEEVDDPRKAENNVWFALDSEIYQGILSSWNVYLDLIKETYKEAFFEIQFENASFDRSAEEINNLVKRRWLPVEIYEKIITILLKDNIFSSRTESHSLTWEDQALLETLVSGKEILIKLLPNKIHIEPEVSKETLIKLTTLSFLALQENAKVKPDIKQKKQCFRLISKAIFKHGSIFNAEIKEKIVGEIGQLDHFSKSNIKKALKKAFN